MVHIGLVTCKASSMKYENCINFSLQTRNTPSRHMVCELTYSACISRTVSGFGRTQIYSYTCNDIYRYNFLWCC